MNRFSMLLAAALLATPTASLAGAEVTITSRIPEDVRVAFARYGDLNLTNQRDQRQLRARISMAVRQVCPDRRSVVSGLAERLELPMCRKNAFDQAEKQMQRAIALASEGKQLANAPMITIAVR